MTGTEKQRHSGEPAIDTFSSTDLAAIERVALAGQHRSQPDDFYGPGVFVEWRRLNQQDAAIFIVAAHTGLRQGELRALRWRHVNLEDQRVTVEAAISAGEVSTTKSRRIRTVPLTETACRQFKRMASRSHFLEPEDFVFCNASGGILDESALRRRFRRVQQKAGLRVRRFHDLRHTFGSIAVRRFDPVTVQTLMGHSSLTTTERYLHSRPRADDAAKLGEAFESDD